jgi:hypothetical protein
MIRGITIALALAIAAPAIADPLPPPGTSSADPASTRREAIKKRIRALRAYTLTEELGLDEVTASKLFPVLAKWDDVTDKLLVQRVAITRQLRAADASQNPRTVDKLVDEAVANQKAFWDLEDRRLVELRKILSPAQTARLLIVLPAFERKIQNQLKRAIQKKDRGGAAVRKNRVQAEYGDDDDDVEPDELPPEQRPRTGPAKQAQPPADGPCDPFSTRSGCKRR